MKTSYQALARSAAQLSMIDFVPPRTAIGKSTEESLQSGAINGYVSVVEGMVARFKAELGGEATVIGTGGVVNVIAQRTDAIDYVDPDLTLKGLKILYNLNRP
jgi:type III pantothenate kinase